VMAPSRFQLTPLLSRFAAAAAQEVGARHREGDICRERVIEPPPGSRVRPAYTTGCRGESKFELPVTGDEGEDLKRPEPAIVCAVDDMAYEFPRYGGSRAEA